MPAVSASRPGWPKEQSILRTGSGIHSLRLRKECAVHSGVILLDTGICNVNGFVGASGIRGFFFNGLRFVYRGNAVSYTHLTLPTNSLV